MTALAMNRGISSNSLRSGCNTYQKALGSAHRCLGKDSGETLHVERWNNTPSQSLGHFVRKALSFSRTEKNHQTSIKLFTREYKITASHEHLAW